MALGDLLSKTSADVRRLKTAGDIQEVAALEKSIQLALLNVEQVLAVKHTPLKVVLNNHVRL